MASNPTSSTKQCNAVQKFMIDQMSFVEQLTEKQQRRLEVEVLDAIFNAERSKCIVHTEHEGKLQNKYNAFLKKISLTQFEAEEMEIESLLNIQALLEVKTEEYNSLPNYTSCMQPDVNELQIESPLEIQQEQNVETADLQLRHVPFKNLNYYVKRVRVRLKRFNLDDYLPPANLPKSRAKRTSSASTTLRTSSASRTLRTSRASRTLRTSSASRTLRTSSASRTRNASRTLRTSRTTRNSRAMRSNTCSL